MTRWQAAGLGVVAVVLTLTACGTSNRAASTAAHDASSPSSMMAKASMMPTPSAAASSSTGPVHWHFPKRCPHLAAYPSMPSDSSAHLRPPVALTCSYVTGDNGGMATVDVIDIRLAKYRAGADTAYATMQQGGRGHRRHAHHCR
jgi:hypothetical protein